MTRLNLKSQGIETAQNRDAFANELIKLINAANDTDSQNMREPTSHYADLINYLKKETALACAREDTDWRSDAAAIIRFVTEQRGETPDALEHVLIEAMEDAWRSFEEVRGNIAMGIRKNRGHLLDTTVGDQSMFMSNRWRGAFGALDAHVRTAISEKLTESDIKEQEVIETLRGNQRSRHADLQHAVQGNHTLRLIDEVMEDLGVPPENRRAFWMSVLVKPEGLSGRS